MVSVRIHHEESGAGEPLLLLNGVMMTTASWAFQTRVLREHYRCVLHDFRGQLRSEKPPGPYAMQQHVDDLVVLMDELHIPSAHLVGTSYGGEVGMLFAATHRERVRSLTAIACVSRPDDALRDAVRRWAAVAREESEALWDLSYPTNYSAAFREAHPEMEIVGRDRLVAMPAEWFRALADLCDAFNELDAPLESITCPTLVICGSEDTLKPLRYSEEIARRIAGALLEVIPGAGHAVVIEQPDAVNALLLRFLASVR